VIEDTKETRVESLAAQVSPERLAVYRATEQRRQERERRESVRHQERAWRVARQAAALLKTQFRAVRVVVFGSLVREGAFNLWSDVDLAAWGLQPEETFRALGAIRDLGGEVEIDVVDMGACRPSVADAIERTGVEL